MKKKGASGFTLIEVMMAAAISSIVILGTNVLYANIVRQEARQRKLISMFMETRLVFAQFQRMIEASGGSVAVDPVIAGDNKSITYETKTIGTEGGAVVLLDGAMRTVLAEESGVVFSYDSGTDTYRAVLVRHNYQQTFEAEVKRRWN